VSKEHMRMEIEQLSRHKHHSDRVLNALSSDTNTDEILGKLRQGHSLEAIAENMDDSSTTGPQPFYQQFDARQAIQNSLEAGRSMGFMPRTDFGANPALSLQPQLFGGLSLGISDRSTPDPLSTDPSLVGGESMHWTPEVEASPAGSSTRPPLIGTWHSNQSDNATQIDRGQDFILGSATDQATASNTRQNKVKRWTAVTDDSALVDHLLTLYFCWEYPTFASLSKEHFLMDYRQMDQRYCSPLLVNALLALGSRFSNNPEVRGETQDSLTAGDKFFAEAKRLFAEQRGQYLTTVQALGLMSIREASCGRSSESWFYSGQSIRMAVEMGLHRTLPGNDEGTHMDNSVRLATFWGAFALDQ
jgi:hypothetical protein